MSRPRLELALTFDRMVLNAFIGQRGCHSQGVTSDTGSDVGDAKRQGAPFLLIQESRHDAAGHERMWSSKAKVKPIDGRLACQNANHVGVLVVCCWLSI